METYSDLKQRQQQAVNDFPMAFAFSDKQLEEALVKLDAKVEDCCSIPGGGIIKKSDSKLLSSMISQHVTEMDKSLADDNFMIDALVYELGNHEYCITYDLTDTLGVLGLDADDDRVQRLLVAAKNTYMEGLE